MTTLPKADVFDFISYTLLPEKKKAVFRYAITFKNRPALFFTEELVFPKQINLKNIPKRLLNQVLQSVHIILGISYYKLYCPPKIRLRQSISREQVDFWNIVYRKGLGEFFYKNKINFRGLVQFPYNAKLHPHPCRLKRKRRSLVGMGGGKDSIVAGELLKENSKEITAFLLETQKSSPITKATIRKMGIPSLVVRRTLDKKIFISHEGAYNGHIPISAVFALIGYLTALLYNFTYVIVGNEESSNIGNVRYKGDMINHQWSKSVEFEKLFQNYIAMCLSPNITYFSLLRQFHEIRIAEIFSKYKQYFPLFSSCNRNYKVYKDRTPRLWCGECAKCVFVFIMLSAFLSKKEVLNIFGRNFYQEKPLLNIFRDVLGFGGIKPFDCVGTFEEAQAAFYLAHKKYKECYIVKMLLPNIDSPGALVAKVMQTSNVGTTPEYFRLLGMKKVLLLGYGKEGKATSQYLRKFYPKIKISIGDKAIDPHYLDMQKDSDLVIKTPGIPKRLVTAPYITATNLFFSQVPNNIIGITGSKGKSTTSSLIYAILKEAGKKVTFLGNIGHPMLAALMKTIAKDELFVVELSSYQLDDANYSPHIAVVLNLFPDHMNYHGSMRSYCQAKRNIINHQNETDFFVYNGQDPRLSRWAKQARAQSISYSDITDEKHFTITLKGAHNIENIKAAIAVAKILNVPQKIIKKAVEQFQPLPHRLEFVGEFQRIRFIDDAISTTPESTIRALEAIPNIGTIFLGGEDRGYDFSQLEKKVREHKINNIVLFPETGKRIFSSKKGLNILETACMRKAVEFAYRNTSPGSVCLLSTASPSYSVWKNFEEKGEQFQYWIKVLAKEKPLRITFNRRTPMTNMF